MILYDRRPLAIKKTLFNDATPKQSEVAEFGITSLALCVRV